MKWHSAATAQLCATYGTDEVQGLTKARYTILLQKFGENNVKRGWKKDLLHCLRLQLKNILNLYMAGVFAGSLLLAGFGMGSAKASLIIALAAAVNLLLGALIEYRAKAPLNRYSLLAAPLACAVREGQAVCVLAAELVPGDVILLRAGERVPADARLTQCNRLACDEYAVTKSHGFAAKNAEVMLDEHTPLAERVNMVHSGTLVQAGTGRAIVTATGSGTELERLAREPAAWGGHSVTGRWISRAGGTACMIALLAVAGVLVGAFFRRTAPSSLWLYVLTAAVAAIPFTLTAAAAAALETGAKRLAEDGVAVKDFNKIETLAGTTVLCTGKTGILTQGEMAVKQLWAGDRTVSISAKVPENVLALLKLAAMCCDDEPDGQPAKQPADTAILNAATRNGLKKQRLDESYPLAQERPYPFERQYSVTVRRVDGVLIAIVKGAYEAVIPHCSGGIAQEAGKAHKAMSDLNLTVIAVAYKPLGTVLHGQNLEKIERGLTLAGLIGLYDPPRGDAQAAIRDCTAMGITPILITGADAATACSAARDLGMLKNERQAISGADITLFTDDELSAVVGTITVYFGISAYDRARVVSAWQKKGHTVLTVGDDAGFLPAFESSDIACCRKECADGVLLSAANVLTNREGLSAVAGAVRGAKAAMESLIRPARYLAALAFTLAFATVAAVWLGAGSTALLPQALFIGLLVSLPFALALGVQAAPQEEQPPADTLQRRNLLPPGAVVGCALRGAVTAAAAVGAYLIGSRLFITDLQEPSAAAGCAMLFLVLLFSQPLLASAYRTSSLFDIGAPNTSFGLAVAFTLLCAAGVAFWNSFAALLGVQPISFVHWGAAVLITAVLGVLFWGIKAFESLYGAMNRKRR